MTFGGSRLRVSHEYRMTGLTTVPDPWGLRSRLGIRGPAEITRANLSARNSSTVTAPLQVHDGVCRRLARRADSGGMESERGLAAAAAAVYFVVVVCRVHHLERPIPGRPNPSKEAFTNVSRWRKDRRRTLGSLLSLQFLRDDIQHIAGEPLLQTLKLSFSDRRVLEMLDALQDVISHGDACCTRGICLLRLTSRDGIHRESVRMWLGLRA